MLRLKNSLFNISLLLNCLLLFLLFFENRISVPLWLQVIGRTHPLVLHFPVVLVVMYALLVLFFHAQKTKDDHNLYIADLILQLAAFTSAITALAGFFLSKEEGYDTDALQWHKWSGVAISLFMLLWCFFKNMLQARKITAFATSIVALVLIVIAGHQGAGITHGENFVLAPVTPEKKQAAVSVEEAELYTHLVKPILEAKCISCHNSKKAKGELVMETEEPLLKGGKNGVLWDSTSADLGLLLRRIHLPLEEKKHMPPQGKPQLTDDEIVILRHWIKKGSDFKLRVADLATDDSLFVVANNILTAAETAEYDFDEADAAVVKDLNTVNRVVAAEALESPALNVSFFNSKLFKAEQLAELSKIKKQIVSLDLSQMPVKDVDMKIIGEFENLRKLNLSFSAITGAGLTELKRLKFLRSLSISGTKVTAEQLKQLQSFPQLKTVYTWNMPVASADMEKVKTQMKNIRFETGFKGDTLILKLSTPIVQNEESIITSPIPLKLKHYINGTTIRFTKDGSDPDSLKSPVFKPGEMIDGNVFIKAKAYKPGWISSDIIEVNFYRSTYKADSVSFLLQPDPAYKGEGKMLSDHIKGELNFRLGSWLAWRQTRMEALLQFNKPTIVKSVTLSTLIDVASYIMPPSSIEIWGGDDMKKMKLLGTLKPTQPTMLQPSSLRGYECKFNPSTVKYIKIIGNTVSKLPAWHPGKGDKGWLFVDEVLVN
ncbi:c-type cytochrome domain-containing protein [Lacibacter sediminis]|uniref:Cytochrome c domain-containing protein n=1 Tax=Lacibacter sediminis TaxID=2760713 RepID=A0A7G5XB51_9BACT|nr:c-type cytochrome domain-containing protein [Lacibacter sediminis]QNA42704.1 hypothetical protein H4075_11385 [Lacibacter sediminis]